MASRNIIRRNNARSSVPSGSKRGGSSLMSLQDEINNVFNDFFSSAFLPSSFWGAPAATFWNPANIANWNPASALGMVLPSLDVSENQNEIKITAELPGLEAEDVNISLSEQELVIEGQKQEEQEDQRPGGYYCRERSYGQFQRVLALPEGIDTENAEAEIRNGVLTIHIPKREGYQQQARRLEVRKSEEGRAQRNRQQRQQSEEGQRGQQNNQQAASRNQAQERGKQAA